MFKHEKPIATAKLRDGEVTLYRTYKSSEAQIYFFQLATGDAPERLITFDIRALLRASQHQGDTAAQKYAEIFMDCYESPGQDLATLLFAIDRHFDVLQWLSTNGQIQTGPAKWVLIQNALPVA